MAKKFEKKLLSSAMAVALASGIGFSGSASAIHLAEDGIGQVLLAPYYTVLNGYETEVAIVNSRSDKAVKAKVVLRSRAQSTEVLDFICYLTPADVCRFTIRMNASGQAEVFSTDDSLKQRSSNAFATAAAPAIYPVFDERMLSRDGADVNEWGHIEVVGAYAVDAGPTLATAVPVRVEAGTAASGVVNVYRTMPKTELARIFDKPRAVLNAADPANRETSQDVTLVGAVPTMSGVASGKIRSADEDWVRLIGTVETYKNDASDRYGYRIPALAGEPLDNTDDVVVDPGTNAIFDGRVISNALFDVNTADETNIGAGFSSKGFGDNIYEIENALVADNLYGEYDANIENGVTNGTGLLVTFPTRYRHRGDDVCGVVTNRGLDAAGRPIAIDPFYTYPFTPNGWIQFGRTQYNNSEQLNIVENVDNVSGGTVVVRRDFLYAEVNAMMMAPGSAWDSFANSGWFDLDLIETVTGGHGTVCAYNGVPTLSFVYDWMTKNSAPSMGNVMNSLLTPASSSPERTNFILDPVYPVGNDMN